MELSKDDKEAKEYIEGVEKRMFDVALNFAIKDISSNKKLLYTKDSEVNYKIDKIVKLIIEDAIREIVKYVRFGAWRQMSITREEVFSDMKDDIIINEKIMSNICTILISKMKTHREELFNIALTHGHNFITKSINKISAGVNVIILDSKFDKNNIINHITMILHNAINKSALECTNIVGIEIETTIMNACLEFNQHK